MTETAMNRSLPVIDFTQCPMPRGPWVKGAPVTIEEHPAPAAGWSLYELPGGAVVVLSPSPESLGSAMLAVLALWRAVANLSRVCPACGARVRLAPSGGTIGGTMLHESTCVLSDEAIAKAHDLLANSGPLPAGMPPAPRQWTVRPPRLAVRRRRAPR